MKACQHADQMDRHRNKRHPPGAKDQKQLNRDHRVDDEERVSHTRKHLRPRERDKQRVSANLVHQGPFSLAQENFGDADKGRPSLICDGQERFSSRTSPTLQSHNQVERLAPQKMRHAA